MQYLAKNENEDYKVARGVVPRTSVLTVLCKSSKATEYFPNSLRGRNHILTKERVQGPWLCPGTLKSLGEKCFDHDTCVIPFELVPREFVPSLQKGV